MRNPLRRFVLLAITVFSGLTLLGSDLFVEPAGAHAQRSTSSVQRRNATAQRQRARVSRPRRLARAPRRARAPLTVAAFGGDVWAALRHCESSGRYNINTGNGYYGAYQFLPATWRSLGYGGMPHQAPPHIQDEAAQRLQARSGWGQWPACTRRLGLR